MAVEYSDSMENWFILSLIVNILHYAQQCNGRCFFEQTLKEPRFSSRPKLSYDQTMQSEMTSDQTFQTEVTSDQTFQTKMISDQNF